MMGPDTHSFPYLLKFPNLQRTKITCKVASLIAQQPTSFSNLRSLYIYPPRGTDEPKSITG